MNDPREHVLRSAIAAAANGQAKQTVPPLVLELHNSNVEVGEATTGPDGATIMVLKLVHASGGIMFLVPMTKTNARVVGNALCQRPNIELPG